MSTTRILKILILCVMVKSDVISQTNKILLEVVQTGDDLIGPRLAFALREEILSSKIYQLTDSKHSNFSIMIASVDPSENTKFEGNLSASCVVFLAKNTLPYVNGVPQTWYPIYLNSLIVTCGSLRVNEQAQGILARFDSSVREYLQNISN